jgi:biopolymer transport protein ExbB/TolQ
MLESCLNSLHAEGCGWDIGYLWRSMGWLSRGDLLLLGLMLANTIAIICYRAYCHRAARMQSRAFVRDSAATLRDGRLDEVISIAMRNRRSHVAAVVAAGLAAFCAAPPHFTDAEAIDASQRAFRRKRKVFAADLKLGIGTPSTIASSAPFIGLFGTVLRISDAFVGIGASKSAAMAFIALSLAEALVTAAMGIAVAIPAVWCRNYLLDRVEAMESEMSNATLEAVTYLHAHCDFRRRPERFVAGTTDLIFRVSPDWAARSWEIRYDRQRPLLLAMWGCMFYIAFILAQGMYPSYLWERSWERASEARVQAPQLVGGQELVSPDHRYRAVIPMIYRWPTNSSNKSYDAHWLCGSDATVALRIVPNDRPLAWKPQLCPDETKYTLEPDQALLTWNCSVPVITWRSNDELLIQCSDCTTDNVQLVKPSFFPGRITLRGLDGKRMYPQVTHPQPGCPD